MENSIRVGFLGAGKIAKSHSYALDVLKYFYSDSPIINKVVVSSRTPASREEFAAQFGFQEAVPLESIWEKDFNTLYILGPNQTHTPQLLQAVQQKNIKRIYIEKPIGTSQQDINDLLSLEKANHGKFIMIGFQYLQKSAIRQGIHHWRTEDFGNPVHFRAEYLHSSYLDPDYRQSHANRFNPIPLDGAAVDLGSHPLSLLVAFLGSNLTVKSAAVSGIFDDVPKHSDLCTTILLEEEKSGAIGTLLASRISSGTGDHLSLEIRGTRGALLYTTVQPDSYKTYLPDKGWQKHDVMSDYRASSQFPAKYTPSGWLRALVHNHYLFLGGEPGISFVPDLDHGIQVQKILQQTANFLSE